MCSCRTRTRRRCCSRSSRRSESARRLTNHLEVFFMKRMVFVTSIIAVLMMTGVVTWYGMTHLPVPKTETAARLGTISTVDLLSENEVRLTFGPGTYGLDFDRCRIVIFSPQNEEVNTVSMEDEQWTYMLKGERLTLTTMIVLDPAFDSRIDGGDSISLYHSRALKTGAWTVRLFVDGSAQPNMEEVFVVPVLDDTPKGVFRLPQMVSDSELLLPFGIFDSKVPFYYTSLHMRSPDGQTQTWAFQQSQPMMFAFNDTIWITIVDMGEQNIINFGDLVRVRCTAGALPEGEWTFWLTYAYTAEEICCSTVGISGGNAEAY